MKILKKIAGWFYREKILEDGRKSIRVLFFAFERMPSLTPVKQGIHHLQEQLAGTQQQLSETRQQLSEASRQLAELQKMHLQRWIEYEKNIIARSELWDPLWYVQQYGHNFNRYEALDYWYETGRHKGERPSAAVQEVNLSGIPSLVMRHQDHRVDSVAFLRTGNLEALAGDADRIADYLAYKKTRKAKGVVYSCITNGYDSIEKKLIYRYTNPDWDYVCFSDDERLIQQGQVGIWEVRPLAFAQLDNTRNSRWHKTHPHVLFPDYEESIFIDGNINILSDYLFRVIREKHAAIVLPRHFKNLCIYQEYADVEAAHFDKPEVLKAELRYIEEQGMPAMYGMGETNILYRRHSEPLCVDICNEWWEMIAQYSKRDQLAFTYVLWKHGIKVGDITFENARMLKEHFFFFNHEKPHPV